MLCAHATPGSPHPTDSFCKSKKPTHHLYHQQIHDFESNISNMQLKRKNGGQSQIISNILISFLGGLKKKILLYTDTGQSSSVLFVFVVFNSELHCLPDWP